MTSTEDAKAPPSGEGDHNISYDLPVLNPKFPAHFQRNPHKTQSKELHNVCRSACSQSRQLNCQQNFT